MLDKGEYMFKLNLKKVEESIAIIFCLIIILLVLLNPVLTNITIKINTTEAQELNKFDIKLSQISESIYIDDSSPGNQWSDALAAGKCTGGGTYSNPYVIKDFIIEEDGTYSAGSCIFIENSRAYFRIENCTLAKSGGWIGDQEGGIKLLNVGNGTLINNNFSSNLHSGIILIGCNNITITSNNIIGSSFYGIYVGHSENLTISQNNIINSHISELQFSGLDLTFTKDAIITDNQMINCSINLDGDLRFLPENEIDTSNLANSKPIYYYKNQNNLIPNDFLDAGQVLLVNCNNSLISNLNISYASAALLLFYCENNTIVSNTFYENFDKAIYFDESNENNIFGNEIFDNYRGIYFLFSNLNNLSFNSVYNNYNGISFQICDNNTVSGNDITYNTNIGLRIFNDSEFNIVFNNTFIGNGLHATDSGPINFWDFQGLGNYWDNYTGVDANDDGIGDIYHTISGYASSRDNYPIWWDSPQFVITAPHDGMSWVGSPAEFFLDLEGGIPDAVWYTLNQGSEKFYANVSEYGNVPGTIDADAWAALDNGIIVITFFMNDSRGFVSTDSVQVIKGERPEIPLGNSYIAFMTFGIILIIIYEKYKKRN